MHSCDSKDNGALMTWNYILTMLCSVCSGLQALHGVLVRVSVRARSPEEGTTFVLFASFLISSDWFSFC